MNSYIFIFTIGVSMIIRYIFKKKYYVIRVSGNSMYPTFKNGNMVIVKKRRKYKRGDIVVFKIDKDGDGSSICTKKEMYLIKRVIGVEGDKIQLKKGDVYVNNELLSENYINSKVKRCHTSGEKRKYEVPKGMIFVMGDNRGASMDSRHRKIGYIELENVVGKVYI